MSHHPAGLINSKAAPHSSPQSSSPTTHQTTTTFMYAPVSILTLSQDPSNLANTNHISLMNGMNYQTNTSALPQTVLVNSRKHVVLQHPQTTFLPQSASTFITPPKSYPHLTLIPTSSMQPCNTSPTPITFFQNPPPVVYSSNGSLSYPNTNNYQTIRIKEEFAQKGAFGHPYVRTCCIGAAGTAPIPCEVPSLNKQVPTLNSNRIRAESPTSTSSVGLSIASSTVSGVIEACTNSRSSTSSTMMSDEGTTSPSEGSTTSYGTKRKLHSLYTEEGSMDQSPEKKQAQSFRSQDVHIGVDLTVDAQKQSNSCSNQFSNSASADKTQGCTNCDLSPGYSTSKIAGVQHSKDALKGKKAIVARFMPPNNCELQGNPTIAVDVNDGSIKVTGLTLVYRPPQFANLEKAVVKRSKNGILEIRVPLDE